MQMPCSLRLNSELFSSYKNHTTLKALVGITPGGALSFVSQLYTGHISDRGIVLYSGFLDQVSILTQKLNNMILWNTRTYVDSEKSGTRIFSESTYVLIFHNIMFLDQKFDNGDSVMADKGFTEQDLFPLELG